MNDFIDKPFELDTMVDAILRHVSVRLARAPEAESASKTEPGPAPGAPYGEPYGKPYGEPFPPVPGIDSDSATRRLLGDHALFLAALRAMRNEFHDAAAQTGADFARGDPLSAARRLHKLRGVAGNVGAQQIAALAGVLEIMLRSEPPALRCCELDALDAAIGLLIAGLPPDIDQRSVMPANGRDPMPLQSRDIEEMMALLADGDMDACQRFDALRPALAARHGEAELALLSEAMDLLRFEEVRARLLAWTSPAPSTATQS
jgi:HPt (histidine-containing phosphotransfer) domain-containing protein